MSAKVSFMNKDTETTFGQVKTEFLLPVDLYWGSLLKVFIKRSKDYFSGRRDMIPEGRKGTHRNW